MQKDLSKYIYERWKSKCPTGWNELAHIENPTINTVTDSEKNLTKCIAKYAKNNLLK